MIDMEPPCSAIKGKGHKIEQGRTEKNEKKVADAEKKAKARQEKLDAMPPDEKKLFLEKESVAAYLKKAKLADTKLTQAVNKSSTLEGHVMTMKKSSYVNPDQIMKKMRAHKQDMKKKLERLLTTMGQAESVNAKTLQQKKFQEPISEAWSVLLQPFFFDI